MLVFCFLVLQKKKMGVFLVVYFNRNVSIASLQNILQSIVFKLINTIRSKHQLRLMEMS